MANITEKSAVVTFRENIGIELLFSMRDNEDLPLPNRYRLAKTMQEYFNTMGKADEVADAGYKWQPNEDYWMSKLRDIADTLRKQHKEYFFYSRTPGGNNFEGVWKFGNKAEYERMLMLEHQEISTRTDNHNEKIEDGQNRWKIQMPRITQVPPLTYIK